MQKFIKESWTDDEIADAEHVYRTICEGVEAAIGVERMRKLEARKLVCDIVEGPKRGRFAGRYEFQWTPKLELLVKAIRAARVRLQNSLKNGIQLIRDERARQTTHVGAGGEGYSPSHDDRHQKCELRKAAECYMQAPAMRRFKLNTTIPIGWPWEREWWKPSDRERELVKAGALFLAESERLTRRGHYPTARLMDAKAIACGKKIDRIIRDQK